MDEKKNVLLRSETFEPKIAYLKKIFYLLAIIGGVFISLFPKQAKAQDPEFTQFYSNSLYLNPAFAGSATCPRVTLNHRNQWPDLSASFVTSSASFDQRVNAFEGGVGLMVMNDRAGEGTLTTTSASGIYSYHLPVTRKFSINTGFQATYFQKSVDWSKLSFGDMIDPRKGFIYQTQEPRNGGQIGNVDFSVGLLGYSEKYFFGVAVHHINQPDESVIQSGDSKLPMKITGHAGAVIPLGNYRRRYSSDNATISPNVLFQQQGEFQQLNIGMYITKGPIVGGLWYRNQDSFIALVGVQTDIMKFGYSYDITVSKLANTTAGSHEMSLIFNFDCRPKRKRFRTISCPSF